MLSITKFRPHTHTHTHTHTRTHNIYTHTHTHTHTYIYIYIYIYKRIVCRKHNFLSNVSSFVCPLLNGFKYWYLTQIILFNDNKISKVGDRCRERPEGSLFNSYYYTKVSGRALLLSLDCSTLPSIRTLYCWVLSKEVSSTIFKVFGISWPGIEPRSPGSLVNTLPTGPMSWYLMIIISCKELTNSIWLLDGTIKSINTLGHCRPGNNGNGIFYILQIFSTWASPYEIA